MSTHNKPTPTVSVTQITALQLATQGANTHQQYIIEI